MLMLRKACARRVQNKTSVLQGGREVNIWSHPGLYNLDTVDISVLCLWWKSLMILGGISVVELEIAEPTAAAIREDQKYLSRLSEALQV